MGRRLSVRVRTTLGATVVVGVALVVAGVLVVLLLRRDLTASVDTAAELRAQDLVVAVEQGRSPAQLVGDGDDDDAVVQFVAPDGSVLAASEDLDGVGPLATRPGGGADVTVPGDDGGHYRVVAVQAEAEDIVAAGATPTTDGPPVTDDEGEVESDDHADGSGATDGADVLVVVARPADTVDEGTAAVRGALTVGIPLLLLVVAGTTWVVVRRALRPVEAMRREVAAITDAELERRVPAPGGRDEVARLAVTMNEMLGRLETSRDRNRRFVSDASHELRSPIATIRHELEVARADPTVVDVAALSERLLAEDLRLQSLVEDLLLLARSDERTLPVRRQPLDLDDLVLGEARRLRQLGTVSVDASAVAAGQVLGDPAQLGQVVRNLVDNAARHAAGAVSLGVAQAAQGVRMWVADDGPGIAPDDRQRVFDRFTRLDEARSRGTGGYGLGLAIVAEVVAAHGGTVAVDEGPAGGARFIVELPVAP